MLLIGASGSGGLGWNASELCASCRPLPLCKLSLPLLFSDLPSSTGAPLRFVRFMLEMIERRDGVLGCRWSPSLPFPFVIGVATAAIFELEAVSTNRRETPLCATHDSVDEGKGRRSRQVGGRGLEKRAAREQARRDDWLTKGRRARRLAARHRQTQSGTVNAMMQRSAAW